MLLILKKNTVDIKKASPQGGGFVFDPLTFDTANLAELWDGDLAGDPAGVANWVGSHAGNTLIYGSTGGGTVVQRVVAGLNGHTYLQFQENGVYGSYAKVTTPVRTQPTTQYIVVGVNSYIGNRYVMDDGVTTIRNTIRCQGGSPLNNYTSVSSGIGYNPGALGTWVVLTIVKQAGAGLSKVQINNNAPLTYTQAVLSNDAGITLNKDSNLVGFTSITAKFAYIILRNGVDTVADQNQFISYLRSRFGI